MSELVTGEAVPLELNLARMPSRALAIAIDFAVLFIVGIGVLIVFARLGSGLDPAAAAAVGITGIVLLLVGVPSTVETLTRGKSLGKLALGLRVVRDDGGPVGFRQALTRALAGVFADFILTSGVGAILCSLANERGKRIGDLLAGTVVVRERIPVLRGVLPTPPDHLAPWAASLDLSRLSDDAAMRARAYLLRLPDLSPHARESLGAALATEMAGQIGQPAPAGTPAWAYLSAVLLERRRRQVNADPSPPGRGPS